VDHVTHDGRSKLTRLHYDDESPCYKPPNGQGYDFIIVSVVVVFYMLSVVKPCGTAFCRTQKLQQTFDDYDIDIESRK
jgi:hypothetical protein